MRGRRGRRTRKRRRQEEDCVKGRKEGYEGRGEGKSRLGEEGVQEERQQQQDLPKEKARERRWKGSGEAREGEGEEKARDSSGLTAGTRRRTSQSPILKKGRGRTRHKRHTQDKTRWKL